MLVLILKLSNVHCCTLLYKVVHHCRILYNLYSFVIFYIKLNTNIELKIVAQYYIRYNGVYSISSYSNIHDENPKRISTIRALVT